MVLVWKFSERINPTIKKDAFDRREHKIVKRKPKKVTDKSLVMQH